MTDVHHTNGAAPSIRDAIPLGSARIRCLTSPDRAGLRPPLRLRLRRSTSLCGHWAPMAGLGWATLGPGHHRPAKRWMKIVARTVTSSCLAISDDADRKQAVKEAKRGESNSAVNGALQLAAVDARMVVDHEDLDVDPWLLNCGNGTLDLRTATFTARPRPAAHQARWRRSPPRDDR